MELRMNGRNALITGGRGHRACHRPQFRRGGRQRGHRCAAAEGLDEAKSVIAAAAKNTKVVTVAADVGTADGCRKAYETAEKAFGQIDVLVNNAGTSQRGPFVEITDELWQHDIDLKLFAAIRLCRLAFPGMKARRWGRIINILNTGAKAPQANGAPTAVTRAAGMALTKILSRRRRAPQRAGQRPAGRQHPEQPVGGASRQRGQGPIDGGLLCRDGQAHSDGSRRHGQEFANMALFLASDAGSYVTGTAINIDGGLTPVV